MKAGEFQKILKLNTLCVGGAFGRFLQEDVAAHDFPRNVLNQGEDFEFRLAASFDKALDIASDDQDIDLVFSGCRLQSAAGYEHLHHPTAGNSSTPAGCGFLKQRGRHHAPVDACGCGVALYQVCRRYR